VELGVVAWRISQRNCKNDNINSSGSGPVAASFEHGNKTPRSIKDMTFHDPMTDYQLLRYESAAFSYMTEIFLLDDSTKRAERHFLHLDSENSQSSA
jgi:hypothetical protein